MSMIENLESRRLMAIVTVTDIVADNRGEATIRLSGDVTGVNKRSVRLYDVGPDGVANSLDDFLVNRYAVVYSADQDRITIRGSIEADKKYRIRIQAQQIKSANGGEMLDGTFTGTYPTGDGVAGGNVNFFVRRNASTTPRVRFATSAGNIDVTMRGDVSGIKATVDNFLNYVDSGRLDGTIIHRKVVVGQDGSSIGIVQGGGFYGTAENGNGAPTQQVDSDDPIALQAGVLSNTVGTIAMARTGDLDSATSQFFLNAVNNTALDTAGGGYAAFGTVSNQVSLNALNAIYNAADGNIGSNTFSDAPLLNSELVVVRRISTLARVDTIQ